MISVLFTPVLVLFLPIFDTVLVSITRRLNGRAVSAGAKDHSSHRLVMLGLSERGAVLTLYAISAMSSAVALLWIRLWPDFGTGVLVLFLVGGTLFWLYLAKVQLPEDWLSRTNVFTVVIPEFLHSIATHAAATLIDIALVLAAMYLAFLLRFEGIPRSLLASVFLSSTLAVGIKIPTMAVFGMYRRAWQVKSIPELYPLFKAGIIGSLALVSALVYMQRFENSSRGVLIIDFVLTFLFCSLARVSDKLFDGGLSKRPRSGCLLVGKNCASIVRTYFGWKGIHECPVAVTGSGPLQQGSTPGVPFIHIHEVPELFTRSLITSVCLLPDCDSHDASLVVALAEAQGIPVHTFGISIIPTLGVRHVEHAASEAVRQDASSGLINMNSPQSCHSERAKRVRNLPSPSRTADSSLRSE